MAYLIYSNCSALEENERCNSIDAAFDRIVEKHGRVFDKRDLFLSYYALDRDGKIVYIIGCAKSGNENYMKKYHWPQFVSYLVELED